MRKLTHIVILLSLGACFERSDFSPYDDLKTSLTVVPNHVAADGNSTARLTVDVLNASSQPFPGASVTVATAAAGTVIVQPSADATQPGRYVGTISCTQAGVATFSAQMHFGSVTVPLSATASLSCVALTPPGSDGGTGSTGPVREPPSAAMSVFAVNPNIAVVTSSANGPTLTVTVEDAQGNPVVGQGVTFTSSGTGNTFYPSSGVTGNLGTFGSVMSSTKAESKTVAANLGAFTQTANVTFVAAVASPANSTFVANPNSQVIADGAHASALTITLVDAFGNAGIAQGVTFTSTGSGNTFTSVSGNADGSGVMRTSLLSTMGETKLVSATSGSFVDTINVVFAPVASVPLSSWSANPTSVPANGVATMTFTLDANQSNGAAAAGAYVRVATPASGATFTPAQGSTGATGVFTTAMTSIYAGVRKVSAYITGVVFTTPVSFTPLTPYCTAPLQEALAFPPWVDVPTGSADAVAFDFNKDGQEDLATLSSSGAVTISMGRGAGFFTAGTQPGVDGNPTAIALGDINNDQNQDIVVSCAGTSTVNVLLGNGDGTFQTKRISNVCSQPHWLAVQDFTGDGVPDVAVACNNANTVGVLLNNGTGTLAGHVDYAVGNGPQRIVATDLNNDHIADLAVTNGDDATVTVLRNQGTGTFAAQGPYAVGATPYGIASLDLNADNQNDLVVVNNGNSTVSVLFNAGGLGFSSQVVYAVGSSPSVVVLGDLDGDTKSDILVTNQGDGTVSFLSHGPGATFAAQTTFAACAGANSAAISDLNGDTFLDVAVTAPNSGELTLLFNNGSGLSVLPSYAFTGGPLVPLVQDIDRDGKEDLLVLNYYGLAVSVLKGHGDGTFAAPTAYDSLGGQHQTFVAADFNGDGWVDVAVANTFNKTMGVLLNNGSGTFLGAALYPTGSGANSMVAGDLNADGNIDVGMAYSGGNAVGVFLGTGSGNFATQVTYPTGNDPSGAVLADLDGDGSLDFAVNNLGDSTVAVLTNFGDGTFSAPTTYPAGSAPGAMVSGDYNGDGLVDLGVLNFFGFGVDIFINQGAGNFPSSAYYEAGPYPQNVTVAELNGDAWPDIVVSTNNAVVIFFGKGDGTFIKGPTYAAGTDSRATAVADFNADGKRDIAVANYASGQVSILLYGSCR